MIKNQIGNISSIYLAWADSLSIRYHASSGGFIKSYLWYLLESKIIDYAIITRSGDKSSPLKPEVIINIERHGLVVPAEFNSLTTMALEAVK
jgi:coenzyme F420-reducing hydrogenase beta subunit